VLIDSTHRRWLVVFAVLAAAAYGLFRYLDRVPGGLTGGSFAGLWYGVLGAAMMVYAGLLSAHRKSSRRPWLGQRKSWLRGHIWLGLLSLVFIYCHSGGRWGGPLEFALWLVFLGVILTGLFGVVVQQFLPRLLTARVPCEAPYEQIPHLCEVMRDEADALVDAACGPYDPSPQGTFENTFAVMAYLGNARAQLRDFYEQDVRPFLSACPARDSPLRNGLQAEARFSKLRRLPGMAEISSELDRLERFCEERRLLAEQERIYWWLHAWLVVHIPLSVALLVLGTAHVVTALYY
jgi:hypothetical protein